MENLEMLYDHYKESNHLSQIAQKQRSKYFNLLCISEIVNLIFLLYPSEAVEAITNLLDNNYSINFPVTISIIQSIIWVFIIYFLIQYIQKNIYIERQYGYLAQLEQDITEISKSKYFNREGENYLKNYPMILNVIDFFYKWIIPLGIIGISIVKIVFEYIDMANLLLTIFDTICCIFIFLLMILYLIMLHSKQEKKGKYKSTHRLDVFVKVFQESKSTNN